MSKLIRVSDEAYTKLATVAAGNQLLYSGEPSHLKAVDFVLAERETAATMRQSDNTNFSIGNVDVYWVKEACEWRVIHPATGLVCLKTPHRHEAEAKCISFAQ